MERPPPRCVFCNTTRSEHDDAAGRSRFRGGIDDELWERRFRVWAVPVVLSLAFLAMQAGTLRSLARTFVTMWLHELGHALSAWFCGYGAFPGPWRTWVGAERNVIVTLAIVSISGFFGYRAHRVALRWLVAIMVCVALLAIVGAMIPSPATAMALFTFFGDAGMMLLGAGLMLTFWAKPGSHLQESWLRWGFVVIGALALADGFTTWWGARADPSVIPYGEIEGVGLSDPTKLIDRHGWEQKTMINRFVSVGVVGLLVVSCRYALGLWQSRHAVDTA